MSEYSQRGGLTLTWTIENFSHSRMRFRLKTPWFNAYSTEWCLIIDGCDYITLTHYMHHDDNFEFLYSILDSEGAPLTWTSNDSQKTVALVRIDEVLGSRKSTFLPNNTLTIQCRILKKGEAFSTPLLLNVRTRIQIDTYFGEWEILEFCSLAPPRQMTKTLGPMTQYDSKLNITLVLDDEERCKFNVELAKETTCECGAFAACKFEALDATGKKIMFAESEHYFEFIDKPWQFTSYITKSMLMCDKNLFLPNGTLTLMFECTLSSGVGYSRMEDSPATSTKQGAVMEDSPAASTNQRTGMEESPGTSTNQITGMEDSPGTSANQRTGMEDLPGTSTNQAVMEDSPATSTNQRTGMEDSPGTSTNQGAGSAAQSPSSTTYNSLYKYFHGNTNDSFNTLSRDLLKLYETGILSDCNLSVGDVTFPVHKQVLCARSPKFGAMFTAARKRKRGESEIEGIDIEDTDAATLRKMIRFMYTDVVPEDLNRNEIYKLYVAADKYKLKSLRVRCAAFLKSEVGISNVCEILVLADSHHDVDLKATILDFIKQNLLQVIGTEKWKKLEKENAQLTSKTLSHCI